MCLERLNAAHTYSLFRRPLKASFDMTTLNFSAGGVPLGPFSFLEKGLLVPFLRGWWQKTLPGKTPLKTTRVRTPEKGTPQT